MHKLIREDGSGTVVVRTRQHGQRRSSGQTLALFALFLIVFVGAAGLAVDYGLWLSARRDYQAVTDSAVLAGAAFLGDPGAATCVTVSLTAEQCARRAAWRNLNTQLTLGLTDVEIDSNGNTDVGSAGVAVGKYTIWVDAPPSSAGTAYPGTVTDTRGALFTRVEAAQPTYFSRIFGFSSFKVGAWSTAGLFPSRFAVITLRRGRNGSQIDDSSLLQTDIKLTGGTTLRVTGGDIGGNFSMKISGTGTKLRIDQPAAVYLIDYASCGSSCWTNGDLIDQLGTPLSTYYPPSGAKKLRRFVPDPNYVAPPSIVASAPAGTVPSDVPLGDMANKNGTTNGVSPGEVDIGLGSVSGATCAAGAPRIGPGTYTSIKVEAGNCLVLDPTNRYLNPYAPSSPTPVAQSQLPGIFYVTGNLEVGNNALIVGDGVTLIFRPSGSNNQFTPNGVVDLNSGKGISAPTAQILGGWTTKGASPYTWNTASGRWEYQASQEANKKLYGRGIALYVLKPSQYGSSSTYTDVVKVSSTGAGFAWQGVTYAPRDDVQIAGQPSHAGIGQLIAWTFTFNGGTNVIQTYDGPNEAIPYLIEPCASATGGQC